MALIRPSTLSLWGREGDVRQQEKKQAGGGCAGWTEGEAGSTPESRTWGHGAVRTYGLGRQEGSLLESLVTGTQLTQGQRATQIQGAAKPQRPSSTPNVTPETKLDLPGRLAL